MESIEISGLVNSKFLNAFKEGHLSVGEFAIAIGYTHEDSMKVLSLMGVDVIDYDFEDEIKFLDSFI